MLRNVKGESVPYDTVLLTHLRRMRPPGLLLIIAAAHKDAGFDGVAFHAANG